MENKPNFPYKTLIWAVFAAVALFVFRPELKLLITNTEELSLFGVEIKASEKKVNTLKDSIQNFETTITALSNQLRNQQNRINDLDQLKAKLEKELAACPEAKEISKRFNAQVTNIVNTNKDLKIKSDKLINTRILNKSTYTVKLIIPSNMVNATIYVDGKEANIVDQSGIFITVKVHRKDSSHLFELKDGKKHCATKETITKNDMELPIICNT